MLFTLGVEARAGMSTTTMIYTPVLDPGDLRPR